MVRTTTSRQTDTGRMSDMTECAPYLRSSTSIPSGVSVWMYGRDVYARLRARMSMTTQMYVGVGERLGVGAKQAEK